MVFSVLLRTGSYPPDINQFQSHRKIVYLFLTILCIQNFHETLSGSPFLISWTIRCYCLVWNTCSISSCLLSALCHVQVFLVAKILHNSKCPSVHLSIRPSVIFSAPIQDRRLKFFVNIPIIKELNNYETLIAVGLLLSSFSAGFTFYNILSQLLQKIHG